LAIVRLSVLAWAFTKLEGLTPPKQAKGAGFEDKGFEDELPAFH
jgi:hypothetical protein